MAPGYKKAMQTARNNGTPAKPFIGTFAFFASIIVHALVLGALFGLSAFTIPTANHILGDTGEVKWVDFVPSPSAAVPKIKFVARKIIKAIQPESKDDVTVAGTSNAPNVVPREATAPSLPVGETRETAETRYISDLTKLLNRNKLYPRESMMREQEGNVVLAVSLDHDGVVHDSRIEKPSPFQLLNDAALATIAHIGRFPAPPASLVSSDGLHGVGSLTLKIPVSFRIERR